MKDTKMLTAHEGMVSECNCLPASFPVNHPESGRYLPETTFGVQTAAAPMGVKVASVANQFVPTPAQAIRQHAIYAGDPVHRMPGAGSQWGSGGKVYTGAGAGEKAGR